MPEHAAFFHFRHWDDFIAKSMSATWNLPASGQSNANVDDIGCMVSAIPTVTASSVLGIVLTCEPFVVEQVLYLRKDGAMAFEACDVVRNRESRGDNILLLQTPSDGESVAKTLTHQRKESEVGPGGAGGSHRADAVTKKHAGGKRANLRSPRRDGNSHKVP
jgi:hypothetical protein